LCKHTGNILGGDDSRHIGERIRSLSRFVETTEDQNGENRPDTGKRNQSEAVAGCIFIAPHRGKPDAHCHNERYGHRTGGNAARIKCHSQKLLRHEQRYKDERRIADDQQQGQADLIADTDDCQRKKQADADCYRHNQHGIGNGGHLTGKDLQIRLGYGNDDAHNKAGQQNRYKLFHFRDLHADAFSDRRHRHLCAELEKSHSDDQHDRSGKEHNNAAKLHRNQENTEHQNNSGDWKNGGE